MGPQRTCLGCRQRDDKQRMTRLVARGAMIAIDRTGGAPGRGGYLHAEPHCLEKFAATKVREFRSLKSSIDRDQRRRIIDAVMSTILLDGEASLT